MRPDPQENADFVTFTEELLSGKFIFCAVTGTFSANIENLKAGKNWNSRAMLPSFRRSLEYVIYSCSISYCKI